MNSDDKSFNILIVDDAPANIQMVANILQKEGYRMAFARSGDAALTHTETTPFDLILLDIMMREMDGYEVCEKLKQNPKTKEIPVIFLTAKTDAESILKGFELGAVDYVTKPFNDSELLARVKTHLELREARQKLQELNATKDKFFSIIAHDLKNPFNALISGSDFLVRYFEELEKDKIKAFLGEINNASRQAFTLLENLLEWSRAQTGRVICKPAETDIHGIVSDTMSLLKQNAEEKQIHLISEITPNTFAYADTDMTSVIIRNLLSNALKYTTGGGEVRIASKATGDFMEISVSDTGVGISKEDMDRLFRIDIKYSTLGTAQEQGTGLGLLLCKEFVEKNGGKIRVASDIGKGSVFCFTLPRGKAFKG
ncbi:hybrid sensor histidine kinase/response regulator [Desulfobacterales bacterium HSG2]|nr:hybrid sensor histidine kinase/response regulator [Desulfobacterales bacterium HSG2]